MDFIKAEEVLPKPVLYICLLISLSIVYVAGKFIYSIFFDKLRHIPGPRLNAVSMVPYARHLIKGTTVKNTIDLHKQYGDVVRIAPNEVSFISADTAFPDIYGFRTGSMKGHLNMNKDPVWYVMPANGAPSILQANDSDHTRGRRILAHAFSERALAAQEPLIQKYIDQLLSGLEKASTAGDEVIDMVRWYNWTTFDVIADLTFGEPFGCLQDQATHQYVALLFSSLRSLRMIYVLAYFPWLKFLGNLVVDQNLIQKRTDYIRWVSGQVKKRMGRQTDRRDFMSEILENNKSKSQGLSQAEIDANAGLILNAGSETTATLLSGVTYLLLKHPAIMQKLKEEIRGTFENYEDIKLDAVSQLSYLMAVLQEALRFFPPLPVGFVRRTNKGGDHISGHYIPENTVVSVSHYAAYHSERNFRDPDLFVPERWLGDERYAHDKRHAYQPFNFGPRSCLGRNLANAEMRLIVAKILWSFDLELQPQSQNWLENCRVMRLWDKPNLEVKLNKVHRV